MDESRAEVEIFGQRLTVRGGGSPEYIRDLAAYLDGRMRLAREQGRVYDPLRLSLLAGLHVTDELFRSRARQAELEDRVRALVERLDEALQGR